MSLKIPGIEGQEPTATEDALDTPQKTEAPGEAIPTMEQRPEPEMQSKTQEPAKALKSNVGMLLSAALVISVAGLGYAFTLNQKLGEMKGQLATAQSVADAALQTAKSVPPPRDFTPDIGRVEATVISKFRVTDEYLQKTIPDEFKKIAALEARLTAENEEMSNSVSRVEQSIGQLQEADQKNEERLTDVITILRNQDRVLRRLVGDETSDAR